ncbi:hypothetical protein [Lacrimispora sp. JR3]|uniref:hypothetical protein n=1 Tax=Lacrimispora sinapis TaxID=3111456 RepID=UPI003749CF26
MCDRVMLTPLTPEERAFAEENHSALEWCMRIQKLDEDLYDVAAFGYLQAVKKWFARPEVRKWSFKTIVKQAVRRSIGHERERQDRQIRTVSLDDVIPGTDDLTYGDTVTDQNIRYLTGGKEKVALKVTYDANIPKAAKVSHATSVEVEKLLEFLGSSHYAMCYEYGDPKEADKKSKALRGWKKYQRRNDFEINKRGEMIFIKKINIKPKKGEKQ